MAKRCSARRESRFAPSKRTSSVFTAELDTQIFLLHQAETAPERLACRRFAIPGRACGSLQCTQEFAKVWHRTTSNRPSTNRRVANAGPGVFYCRQTSGVFLNSSHRERRELLRRSNVTLCNTSRLLNGSAVSQGKSGDRENAVTTARRNPENSPCKVISQ